MGICIKGVNMTKVAIVLTVYGIETENISKRQFSQSHVAIVLTVYGIETALR